MGSRERSAPLAPRAWFAPRVGKRGVSAYLERAAQRQIERDNLDELIADFDEANGPADPEAVAAKRAKLTGGTSSGSGAAA
ncbi:hypothetical protein [Streptomyces sp. NPDC051909]|uniref:hypothetical protein n=1 Tax=Streptomyces sp. NPDC051909 TaxID=3154944 RepID=UPI00342B7DFE